MIETILSHWELRLAAMVVGFLAWVCVVGILPAWLDNRAARRREHV